MRPFLSVEAMHQLHIFIFVLAIVHVLFSVLTMLLGSAKIRTWKPREKDIQEKGYNPEDALKKITHVANDDFVKTHAIGTWGSLALLSWIVSFFRQSYGSVKKSDYSTLRLSFIEKHCKSNPAFNFHNYMMKTLEADFKKVVGISASLWGFVVIFLLLNIEGWHTYFWIAFIPLILLLAVGAKLEHIHDGISVWQRKAKVKAEERSSNKPEDDDKGSVQLLKINGTSIHGSETTECSESKIDVPRSP